MIYVRNVSTSFDRTQALDGFGMTVKSGSIYGLVGTNGAGKTTILKMLAGVLKPDGGDIMIADAPVFDNEAVKNRLTFIPDDLSFFNKYTPKDMARLYASLYDRWNGEIHGRIMWEFRLDMNISLSRFSKGMQKQAVFAIALATMPDYLLLDEPIDGLDPFAKRMVWNYILDATARRGMTTLVSSHNLREMEGICGSVGIIDRGRMVLEKELDVLRGDIHKVQISFGRVVVPADTTTANASATSGSASATTEGVAPASVSATPEGAYANLNVVHMERRGAVDVIIVRESREALEQWNAEYSPLLFDPIPLTLEEVFIYELGGADHANYSIFE
jgi:ABC-2 type transport system ATP-binding protein